MIRQLMLPPRQFARRRIANRAGAHYTVAKRGGERLKIDIETDESIDEEVRVRITCKEVNRDVERIIGALRMLEKQLTGKKDGQTFIIPVTQVIYIEAVERKCFFYTKESVYESEYKLYELEQLLSESSFFRVSRQLLVNLKEVKSLKAEFDRRIRVTLCNGEQIIASRQYADGLKQRLGIKGKGRAGSMTEGKVEKENGRQKDDI